MTKARKIIMIIVAVFATVAIIGTIGVLIWLNYSGLWGLNSEASILTEKSDQQGVHRAFAIQNYGTNKNIRPRGANTADETNIILYPHHEWKCLTWRFIWIEGNTYQLENLYTEKTLTPSSAPISGVSLWQQPLNENNPLQHWELILQDGNKYLIRLKDTDLYITLSSSSNDSAIILKPLENSDNQLWRLFEQYPRH